MARIIEKGLTINRMNKNNNQTQTTYTHLVWRGICQQQYLAAIFQAHPISVIFLCSCDMVNHKQEVCFLLYLLGLIVTWQYSSNLLD